MILHEQVPALRLEEMFTVNVEEICNDFRQKLQSRSPRINGSEGDASGIAIIQDKLYRRLKSTVDLDVAASVYYYKWHDEDINNAINRAVESLRNKLKHLNDGAKHVTGCHVESAIDNVLAGARYERLQADGPRLSEVSDEHPLIHRFQN